MPAKTRTLETRVKELEETVMHLAVLLSAYLGTTAVKGILTRLSQGDGSR